MLSRLRVQVWLEEESEASERTWYKSRRGAESLCAAVLLLTCVGQSVKPTLPPCRGGGGVVSAEWFSEWCGPTELEPLYVPVQSQSHPGRVLALRVS